MLALRKTGPQPGLNFEEVAAPGAPGPDEALIQVEAAGICGSDLHVYDWDASYEFMRARLPVTIGHEFCVASWRWAARPPGWPKATWWPWCPRPAA